MEHTPKPLTCETDPSIPLLKPKLVDLSERTCPYFVKRRMHGDDSAGKKEKRSGGRLRHSGDSTIGAALDTEESVMLQLGTQKVPWARGLEIDALDEMKTMGVKRADIENRKHCPDDEQGVTFTRWAVIGCGWHRAFVADLSNGHSVLVEGMCGQESWLTVAFKCFDKQYSTWEEMGRLSTIGCQFSGSSSSSSEDRSSSDGEWYFKAGPGKSRAPFYRAPYAMRDYLTDHHSYGLSFVFGQNCWSVASEMAACMQCES